MSPSDTATTSRSARHGHGAAFGGSNSSDARSNGNGSKQSRRLHRSLPVTTSEVASCLSRKRKMMSTAAAAAEEEESPTMTTGGQNLLLPSATAAANTSGGNTSGNTNKKTIAPSGRPRTAPAVAPFADQTGTNKPPAVNATSTAHHQSLVPRTATGTTTSGYIGTSWGGWGGSAMMGSMRVPIFAGSLTVPARPTKKTGVKRSRILAGGIVVDGGTGGGGGGGSAYGFAFNGSGHASNTSASSYYLYHGHRHTNDARLSPSSPRVYHDCYSTTSSRSSSSFDSFHDCLSCEEDEQNGNSHKYEVSFDLSFRVYSVALAIANRIAVICHVHDVHVLFFFACPYISQCMHMHLLFTFRIIPIRVEHSRHQLRPVVLQVRQVSPPSRPQLLPVPRDFFPGSIRQGLLREPP